MCLLGRSIVSYGQVALRRGGRKGYIKKLDISRKNLPEGNDIQPVLILYDNPLLYRFSEKCCIVKFTVNYGRLDTFSLISNST